MTLEYVYVLIETDPGQLEDVIAQIKRIDSVAECTAVTGRYDILVKIQSKDLPSALRFVVKDIRHIQGIKDTETLVCVDVPPKQ